MLDLQLNSFYSLQHLLPMRMRLVSKIAICLCKLYLEYLHSTSLLTKTDFALALTLDGYLVSCFASFERNGQ